MLVDEPPDKLLDVFGTKLEGVPVWTEDELTTIESAVALEPSRLPALLELDMLAIPLSVCRFSEVCGPGLVLAELGDWYALV